MKFRKASSTVQCIFQETSHHAITSLPFGNAKLIQWKDITKLALRNKVFNFCEGKVSFFRIENLILLAFYCLPHHWVRATMTTSRFNELKKRIKRNGLHGHFVTFFFQREMTTFKVLTTVFDFVSVRHSSFVQYLSKWRSHQPGNSPYFAKVRGCEWDKSSEKEPSLSSCVAAMASFLERSNCFAKIKEFCL